MNAVAQIEPTYHGGAKRWQDVKHVTIEAAKLTAAIDIDAAVR